MYKFLIVKRENLFKWYQNGMTAKNILFKMYGKKI